MIKSQEYEVSFIVFLCVLCVFVVNAYSDQPKTDDYEKLIQKLYDKNIKIRKEAISEIGARNNLTAARLILTVADDKELRPDIIQALAKITDNSALKFLQEDVLFFPNAGIRLIAASALAARDMKGDEYYNQVIIPLAKAITDPDVSVRLAVVQATANYTSPGRTPQAIDKDSIIFPLLKTALNDEAYPQVREASVYTLIRFLANPDILELLLNRCAVETNLTVQWTIEELIAGLGVKETLDYLALNGLKHHSMAVRALSARILGRKKADAHLDLLKATLKDDTLEVLFAKDWAIEQFTSQPVSQSASASVDYVKLPPILSLRLGADKEKALRTRGARMQTEQAVAKGLDWLARNQEDNGSWSCAKHNPWHGKLPLPGFTYDEDELLDPSVTGLSLLCFMASGSTHHYGPQLNIVERGLRYLIDCQDQFGCINLERDHVHTPRCLRSGADHGDLVRRYNHNISTLALVELYAMTQDPILKPYAQKALNHSQDYLMKEFSWSFYLEPTDIGPSIFYIFALRIAQETDLLVSPDEITKARTYIKTLTDVPTGRILHICPIPVCYGGFDSTSTGIVARFLIPPYDDKTMAEVQTKAREFLSGHPPIWRPLYQLPVDLWESQKIENDILNEWYWYYATIGLLAMGGHEWQSWNRTMQGLLLRHQRQGGEWDGSWDPEGPWATIGGRVYSTTFAVMTLQTYYSYDLSHGLHR